MNEQDRAHVSEAAKLVRQLVDDLREQPLKAQPEDELAPTFGFSAPNVLSKNNSAGDPKAFTCTIVDMKDVVQVPICAHGRRVGELCPHCMATVCIRP